MFEWGHLRAKLRLRSPAIFASLQHITEPASHPLFEIVPGAVRDWEKHEQPGKRGQPFE